MDINTIIKRKKEIDAELARAIASMEKKNTIFELRQQIKDLQSSCPHPGYNFEEADNPCPFCGYIHERTR